MKKTEAIYFSDQSFPLAVNLDRISTAAEDAVNVQAIHEAIEIKYFYKGESTLLVGEDTVEVRAGDVVVINPYEFHATLDGGGENVGRYHLFMIGLDFFEGAQGAGLDLRHLVFGKHTVFKNHFSGNERMCALLLHAAEEVCNGDSASRLALFGIFAQLFAELLRCGTESRKTSGEDFLHYYNIIEPAIRMIRDEYSKDFTVEMLAEACSISKFHFCRVFKTVMGMGAIKYLNVYRLKIADNLLANTDRQISEIAYSCGFEDAGYFARSYKKQYGCSPSKRAGDTSGGDGEGNA